MGLELPVIPDSKVLTQDEKLLIIDGKLSTSNYGKMVSHPFSGVGIADRFNLPPEVQHIIATHSVEGDLRGGKRTVESIIVHHADFVSFEPFKA